MNKLLDILLEQTEKTIRLAARLAKFLDSILDKLDNVLHKEFSLDKYYLKAQRGIDTTVSLAHSRKELAIQDFQSATYAISNFVYSPLQYQQNILNNIKQYYAILYKKLTLPKVQLPGASLKRLYQSEVNIEYSNWFQPQFPSINIPHIAWNPFHSWRMPKIMQLTGKKSSPFHLSISNAEKKKYIYTVSEAASFLGISSDTLRNWEDQGKLVPQRTPKNYRRYTLSQLNSYLKSIGGSLYHNINNPEKLKQTASFFDYNFEIHIPSIKLPKLQSVQFAGVLGLLLLLLTAPIATYIYKGPTKTIASSDPRILGVSTEQFYPPPWMNILSYIVTPLNNLLLLNSSFSLFNIPNNLASNFANLPLFEHQLPKTGPDIVSKPEEKSVNTTQIIYQTKPLTSLPKGITYIDLIGQTIIDDKGNIYPTSSNTNQPSLGTYNNRFYGIYANNFEVNPNGDLKVLNNTQLGDSNTDSVNFIASLGSNLVPSLTNTYTLGNGDNYFKEAFVTNFTGSLVNLNASQGSGDTTLQSGAGVPSNSLGRDGDYYFRTDGTDGATSVYYKVSGSWTAAGGSGGGGGGASFTGTPNTLAKFDATGTNIEDSNITDNGSVITLGSDVSITGGLTLSSALLVTQGGTGAINASGARTNLGLAIGSDVQGYDTTLAALAAYNTNGILVQTAADTFTGRTLTGTSGVITISNGNGVSGNPTVTIDPTYLGQTSITTLGTITSGTWNGTAITDAFVTDALTVSGGTINNTTIGASSASTGNFTTISLNGTSINTAGTLTNVAYTNQANTFGAFNQTFDTNTLFVDAANNHVGIGTVTTGKTLEVVGEVVGRASASTGGVASSFAPSSSGLTLWVNSSYDPSSPGTGWARGLDIDTSGKVGIGSATPGYKLDVLSTSNLARFGYDTSNYLALTVSSSGNVNLNAVGAGASFTFADAVQADTFSSSGATITGGSINGTTIGASTPSTGAFTTLSSTGATTLGNNSSTVAINSSSWDISSAGVASGFTGITSSGTINFSTLGVSSAVYTDGSSNLTTTAPTSGTIGYWSRSGTTLSPVTAGDAITTSGNISTSGSGTITSAGLLTGSAGANISGGTINLNASSNFATNINTGTSNAAVSIGNSVAGAIGISTGSTFGVTTTTSSQTFTSAVASTNTTSSAFVFTDNSLSSGTGIYGSSTSLTTGKLAQLSTGAANTLTSGTLLDLRSTATSLTGAAGTGSFLNLDWTPGSSTTATGDLFALNIGANGTTTGSLFNILDSGSSIFSVSETAVTTSLPVNFTAPGDTSFAYDINFTNPTASFIKSLSNLTLAAGETFNSSDLTLQTYNQGTVYIDSGATTGTSFSIPNNNLTTGTLANLSSTSATSGTLLNIAQTTSTFTGNLAAISLGTGSGIALNVTNGGSGSTVRFNDDGTFTDSTPFLIDAAGNTTIGSTTATSLFNVGSSAQLQITSAGALSTSSNISTTSTGTITSAGLLTGSLGATISGATTSINASSNFATNINTGTSNGAVSIGNSAAGAIGISTASTFGVTTTTSSQTFTSAVVSGTTTGGAFVFTDNALTTGTGIYASSTSLTQGKLFQLSTGAANTLTTGTLLDLRTTATSLTGAAGTGSLANLDWSPGSATTATGDLFALNIGTNGTTTGNLFNILDSGSSIFSVSEAAVTTSLPASFTAPGDTSFAYDINFTNPTASFIKSAAPITIQPGETFNSSNLTLKTFNQGTVVLDSAVTTGTALDLTNSTLTSGTLANFVNSSASATGNTVMIAGGAGASGNVLVVTDDGTTTDSTAFSVDYQGIVTIGNIPATGSYTNALCWDNSGASQIQDCVGSASADYMEMYPTEQGLELGDVVMPSTNYTTTIKGDRLAILTKAAGAYQSKTIGIISDKSQAGDFNSVGYNIKDSDSPLPVALNGRVLVKVSAESEPIAPGDYLTTANQSGRATKATNPGIMIGKALESWEPGSGKDKVMVFVNISYADPRGFLASLSNISLNKDGSITPTITNSTDLTDPKVLSLENQVKDLKERLDNLEASSSATNSVIARDEAISSSSANTSTLALSPSNSDVLGLSQVLGEATSEAKFGQIMSSSLETMDATVSGNLKAYGETFLANTNIAGDFTVDGTLSLTGNSINSNAIDDSDQLGVLFIQNNALATLVDFFNGKVKVDNLGNIATQGQIFAQKINLAAESVGSAVLKSGQTSMTIKTTLVTPNSKVFLTPTSLTGNRILVVTKKVNNQSFTVEVEDAYTKDINFDWWIVDQITGEINKNSPTIPNPLLSLNKQIATSAATPLKENKASSSAFTSPLTLSASPSLTINNNSLGFLRVRATPSTTSDEMAQVKPGEKYTYLQTQSGWFQIQLTDGTLGWVKGIYVTKN